MPDLPDSRYGKHDSLDSTHRAPPPTRERMPTHIGRYAILREIASGGMGTIYEAQQENPKRSVAVKVMKAGMLSEVGLRRFEYEAHLLARLRHPCVAQVYEAGKHIEGATEIPFFAMEYIPNATSVTDYASQKRLSQREKLKLFAMICDGVHHGHQRGIIHRDLKPSNILVDSEGRPKLIDFGVARATDSTMPASDQGHTQFGQLVGTLQYMSPEQLAADPNDIDTRSDVYSLGVILYELLSGRLPYTTKGTPVYDIPALVRETTPAPLRSLDPSIDTDLQTIVGHALAKDREQRYQSAFGLMADINRFLSGAAIAARPPSLRYQLRILARRNKVWIGAIMIVLVTLLIGGVVSTSMYVHAEAQRAEATLQAERSQRAFSFVRETLLELWPRTWGQEPTIDDLIASMRERVDVDFANEPEIAAQIHRTLGWASLPLEQFDMFETHCRAAASLHEASLGPTDPRTIQSLLDLATAQTILGEYDSVVETRDMIATYLGTAAGVARADLLDARELLAGAMELAERDAEARDLMRDIAAERSEFTGMDDRDTLYANEYLSRLILKLGETDRALELAQGTYDRAIKNYGPTDETSASIRSTLAACYVVKGNVGMAADLFDQPLPSGVGITKSYQGSADISRVGPQILIMWETWCPYSQRVVPELENVYQRYKDAGLQVAGLTRVTRSSSDERVEKFIRDKHLSFPILQDNGMIWKYFDAHGTPYTILLMNGRVVWRGSTPTSSTIAKLLAKKLVDAYQAEKG